MYVLKRHAVSALFLGDRPISNETSIAPVHLSCNHTSSPHFWVMIIGCVVSLVCSGCSANAASPPASNRPYLIRLTGESMAWRVRYAGPDEFLDTPDDILSIRDIHLPAERPVKILLTSRDLLYTLAIQRHRVHEIAVPDIEIVVALPPDRPGAYRFQGDQMCGFQHDVLFGQITVHRPAEFDNWIASHSGH